MVTKPNTLFDYDLLTATDTQIWQRGSVQNLVIFSKDVDFYDRALLFGAPPQVLHVALATVVMLGSSRFWRMNGPRIIARN